MIVKIGTYNAQIYNLLVNNGQCWHLILYPINDFILLENGWDPLLGGSWGPILQLDMENWIGFLEVLNLTYNILDFVQVLFFPDDLLNNIQNKTIY